MDTDARDTERFESDAADEEKTAEAAGHGEQPDADSATAPDEAGAGGPLTITLPDGSESVSEAILSNRQMLTNPSEHGLVSAEEAEEAREAIETLAAEIPEDLEAEVETLRGSIEGMTARLDRHERRIAELQDTVESLADILGASVELEHRGKA